MTTTSPAASLTTSLTARPVTPVPVAPVPVAPSAFDPLLAAEAAAWDAYEADLAVAQEEQDALVSAGSSVLEAYRSMQWRRDRACNALEAVLAVVAHAEYEDARRLSRQQPDESTLLTLPPAKVNCGNVDALSLSELEAAMLASPYGDEFDVLVATWTARLLARVVTGDDGLDHYL